MIDDHNILREHKMVGLKFHVPSEVHTILSNVVEGCPWVQEKEHETPISLLQVDDNTAFPVDTGHKIAERRHYSSTLKLRIHTSQRP